MDIYKRIGEALASQGKITSVLAMNAEEVKIMTDGGFALLGSVDINGTIVQVYSIEQPEPEPDEFQEFHYTPLKSVYYDKDGMGHVAYEGKPWEQFYSEQAQKYETFLWSFKNNKPAMQDWVKLPNGTWKQV